MRLKIFAYAKLDKPSYREEYVVPVPLYQAKAEFFRTLGHPARIRILELLSERDHAVHELIDAVGVEPSNMSQQLAVLRRANMVVTRRDAAPTRKRPPRGLHRGTRRTTPRPRLRDQLRPRRR